ncbi:hypothetical protein [Flavobacterium alkalisoli]|uniref:hypothetical protein n=1 Tax=Flavobacterium alkalisoli TaxID=2602769 RepID=UPI003A93669B
MLTNNAPSKVLSNPMGVVQNNRNQVSGLFNGGNQNNQSSYNGYATANFNQGPLQFQISQGGYNPYNNGSLGRPTYQTLGNNGNLNNNLKMFNPYNDQRQQQLGMQNKWNNQINSNEMTDVAKSQTQLQDASFANQMNQSNLQSRSNMQTNLDQMAMRGGFTDSSAERMSNNLIGQQNKSMQDLRMQNELGKLGIVADDNAYKRDLEQNLYNHISNRELADAKLRDADITRGISEHRNYYDQQMKGYQAEMERYGAERTAQAQENASSGGMCFVTTACCELLGLPDDNNILNTFRKWRDEDLGGKDGVSEYYEFAPKILKVMEDKGETNYLYKVISNYLIPMMEMLNTGKKEEAYEAYKEMSLHLKQKYLGGK